MSSSSQVGWFVAAGALAMGSWLSASAARAATFDGGSGVDFNWSNPANWVEKAPPTSGSPNLQVRLSSNVNRTHINSNQNLAAPFVLQQLSTGPIGDFTHHAVNGSPLAFSNLGAPPSITSLDFLSPPLTINSDMIFNADVTAAPPGFIPSITEYSFNGAISGAGGLRLGGGGRLLLGGTIANAYAGLTTLVDGVLHLNKPASILAVPGDLVINTGGSTRSLRGEVIVGSDNQISAAATATINSGVLSITGGDQTLANVRFTGANIPVPEWSGGDVVIGPSRTLTITGGITRTSNSPAPFFLRNASLISGGTLDLAGGMRPFHVDDANPIGSPTTLTVSSVIANGGIEKTGLGVLHLSGAKNIFTGNVLVNGGRFSMGQGAELRFDLKNSGVSNRVAGTASAELNGIFRIDATSVTDASGRWNLVDVANLNEIFGQEFNLRFTDGRSFSNNGGGVYVSGRWKFTTADGNLTLSAVPEPTSGLLTMLAVIAAGAWRRARVAAA